MTIEAGPEVKCLDILHNWANKGEEKLKANLILGWFSFITFHLRESFDKIRFQLTYSGVTRIEYNLSLNEFWLTLALISEFTPIGVNLLGSKVEYQQKWILKKNLS